MYHFNVIFISRRQDGLIKKYFGVWRVLEKEKLRNQYEERILCEYNGGLFLVDD